MAKQQHGDLHQPVDERPQGGAGGRRPAGRAAAEQVETQGDVSQDPGQGPCPVAGDDRQHMNAQQHVVSQHRRQGANVLGKRRDIVSDQQGQQGDRRGQQGHRRGRERLFRRRGVGPPGLAHRAMPAAA